MAKSTMIVLMNLSRTDNAKKPGMGTSLDVVQEINDGRSWGVGVEKVFFMENGAKRIPKKMERKDFKTCAERWPEILSLMDNPPKVEPPPAPSPLPAPGAPMASAPLASAPLGSVAMTSTPIERPKDDF